MGTHSSDDLLSETQAVAIAPSEADVARDDFFRDRAVTRVLHVINGENYAGAERVQDLLAECLPEYGFEVGFVCLKQQHFAESRKCQTAPLYDMSMQSRYSIGVVGKIARLVRDERYGLIHCHTARSAMVGSLAARLAGVPMVYHVHSPTLRNTTRPWLNRINNIVERLSLLNARRLICVSESLARHMIGQGFKASRVSVVHNGVPSVGELPIRSAPQGTWTIGTAALFRPRKGMEVLLEVISLLRKKKLSVRLRAVGKFESGDYEKEIHALVERLGLQDIVEWPGFSSDVTAELLKMDIFVLPSLFGEGLPMAVLEAMAAGVPVAATDVEGTAEAVRHGLDGLIAMAGDADGLARTLSDVIEGRYDWSAMRQSCMERQAKFFSDRSMAAGVAEVYREVLEGE